MTHELKQNCYMYALLYINIILLLITVPLNGMPTFHKYILPTIIFPDFSARLSFILCRAPEEKTYLVRVIGEGSVGEIVVSI